MKPLSCLFILSILLLSACAHMDNSFLRSAEPLKVGYIRASHSHSTSYSLAPLLTLYPDSLNTFSRDESRALISMQHPLQLEAALNARLSLGIQASVWLGKGFDFAQYFEFLNSGLAGAGKFYAQYSIPVERNLWLSLTPTVTYYVCTVAPHKEMLLRQFISGLEFPLTATKVTHYADYKTSNSLTLRYIVQTVRGDLKVRRRYSHYNLPEIYLFPDQPVQKVDGIALIHTFGYEKENTGRFFDLGLELTGDIDDWLLMPVFGFRWYTNE